MVRMTPLLDTLTEIAGEAAAIVRRIYSEGCAVRFKGPNDPVTIADCLANRHICDRLRARFPDCALVAEESLPEEYATYRTSERVFFIDPLDGTREFIQRTGEFVVMIGYLENDRATAGVIHSPLDDRVWIGQLGVGAYGRVGAGSFRALSVTAESDPARSRILVSRSQNAAAASHLTRTLGTQDLVAMGSAGLKGAGVAEGSADAYIGLGQAGKRWDVCAPDAIVTAAGGLFTDSDGNGFDYRAQDLTNTRGILAGNPPLFHAILEQLRRDDPSRAARSSRPPSAH